MSVNTLQDVESDSVAEAQLVLIAASQHNIESLRTLLRTASASFQDPETGTTPLHAAIASACPSRKDVEGPTAPNGEHVNRDAEEEINEKAVKTVKLLLQNGAIWNDVDKNDETPGCLALRLGLQDLYEIMVDAGVRAEILLNKLDEYEQLKDEDSEDGADAVDQGVAPEVKYLEDGHVNKGIKDISSTQSSPDIIAQPTTADAQPNHHTYLSAALSFHPDRILDASANSVMMTWETAIMSRSASLLAPSPGLRILNIGHGMGIIDSHFQSTNPSIHHIIEAHPSIIARMREEGWYEKPGVVIHEGRWQDILPDLVEKDEATLFDSIYFDTFAEPYSALHQFFDEFVIGLLEEDGKWGFFNGLGADRQICYDVYGKVVEMDLFEAGFDVEWTTMPVPDLDGGGEWKGVRRPYWKLREYRLPVCQFAR